MRRINLLPKEVETQKRARRQQGGLVVVFIVWLALLGGLWLLRQGTLHKEQDRLSAAQARVATLQAQVKALQQFADLEKVVTDKEASLRTAMAGDVAWSRLLVEFSMIIPGDSWITAFNGTAAPPAAPAAGATPAATPAPAPKYGSLSMSAVTFDFPGVAKWLTRLQELKSFQNVWVPSASRSLIGSREVVNFSSTTDLSAQAASKRFQQ